MIKSKKSEKEKSEKENSKKDMKETEIPISDSVSDSASDSASDSIEAQDTRTDSLNEQLNRLKDQYIRKAAEFENFKKRTDAEKSEFYSYANEKLILELLPVLDDFERVMKSYDKAGPESFKEGVKLVYDKFKKAMEKQGVKEIDSNGKPFDVHLHEAIMQQPSEAEPNTVINTIEKGYYLKDKVLRHAKVIVSNKPE